MPPADAALFPNIARLDCTMTDQTTDEAAVEQRHRDFANRFWLSTTDKSDLAKQLARYERAQLTAATRRAEQQQGRADQQAEWAIREATRAEQAERMLAEAVGVLSHLSSYLGAGMGDDETTIEQFDARIRWGIDFIGSVYRERAAAVVEECSKTFHPTWGTVKRAILDDTALPTATIRSAASGEQG